MISDENEISEKDKPIKDEFKLQTLNPQKKERIQTTKVEFEFKLTLIQN